MPASHLILENQNLFKDYYLEDEKDSIKYLPNFNTINIIIGANNSGKSRFMRNLMSLKEIETLKTSYLNEYNKLIRAYNSEPRSNRAEEFRFQMNFKDTLKTNLDIIRNCRFVDTYRLQNSLPSIEKELFEKKGRINSYYIPTLRTAHSLFNIEKRGNPGNVVSPAVPTEYSKVSKDIYHDTLRFYYQIDTKVDIFTGMSLYKEILSSRNSEKKIRNRFSDFEKFLSENFFDFKQIDIVAKFDKNENEKGKNISELILIYVEGDVETRKLYELGDGIQAIIILMYKIFMAEKDSFIYIDEPELHLHPGMQRLFLEQICNNNDLKEKNLTYIITTHSNHFLDLTIEKDDVSIYSFSPKNQTESEDSTERDKEFIIKNVNRGDNQILKQLGVNNSSVFMANCSIWVEGVSDRNYIKAFLKSYISFLSNDKQEEYKSIKEDIDYAFFEYAGSNIQHYIFGENLNDGEKDIIEKDINALALSNRIFLLADSDNAKAGSAKADRLKEFKNIENNNITFKVIEEVREIENLLPNEVWSEVLINFCNKNIIKGKEQEVQGQIVEILEGVNASDYKNEYIGKFLRDINRKLRTLERKPILNAIYQNKLNLGTLKPKRELSELVLNANFAWDIFQNSPEIVGLTKEIYEFILNKD